MKNISKIIIAMILLQLAAIGVIMGTSRVQDVTLATDEVVEFNGGWSIRVGDGAPENISSIPYYGKSDKDEVAVAENIVPGFMCGKTLCFLSADKNIQIFVDDDLIYSFGTEDERKIGHTPGSVMVFADIPQESAGAKLRIEMQSPYADYATYMTSMIVGDRDVVILYFLKNAILPLICCLGILVCGILMLIFATVMATSASQNAAKLYSIGIYFIVLFIYHMIETKVPMIFYGNQLLYSNLVFISLMTAPFFSELYLYECSDSYKKGMKILMCITAGNIIVQLILQAFNICDFMNMAFISHGLLSVVIVVVLMMEIRNVRSQGRISCAFVGILVVAVCSALDLYRCYTVKVGDLGKYTRVGVFFFGICMVITCIEEITQMQVQYAENRRSEKISTEIIQTLITAIDAKDVYTKGHSTRVADYSVILAKRLGWDEERVASIRYKAMLHDVGKIGIPDRVLNKADRLTDEEYEIIKSHTLIGAEMLQGVSSLSDMYIVARNHHERFDGKGYPDRKSGKDIPEEARLVGIVDAYDAMASDRAYRKALPENVIRGELIRGRGTQFDPEMTDVFLELLEEGALNSQTAEDAVQEEKENAVSRIQEIVSGNNTSGAIKVRQEDMNHLYRYIDGIHERYGIDFQTVIISLIWEDDIPMADVNDAMKAMEFSIRQSLRQVDVMTRISESQFLILLTEAHDQNLQMIVERIFASFFKNCLNTRIKPSYEMK